MHQGKTRVWNKAGAAPTDVHTLQPIEQSARVWVGDQTLPPEEQGLQVLGTPVGSPDYILAALRRVTAKHATLFERIGAVPDLQTAFLLLTFCASPQATYLLRALPPLLTQNFAQAHDGATAACLAHLLGHGETGLQQASVDRARLPFRCGGLGLRSAEASRHEAHWASWADTLPTLQHRLPGLHDQLLHLLTGEVRGVPTDVDAACRAAREVRQTGFAAPPWTALPTAPPACPHPSREPDPAHGWQRIACQARDDAESAALLSSLDTAARALMLSQAGTHASRAFTAFPTAAEFRVENPLFRIMLLRRLRLPLPISPRHCSCHRVLDVFGDHRAACAQAGVLRSRAVPLERALARICREAGARVATNVPLNRMNLPDQLSTIEPSKSSLTVCRSITERNWQLTPPSSVQWAVVAPRGCKRTPPPGRRWPRQLTVNATKCTPNSNRRLAAGSSSLASKQVDDGPRKHPTSSAAWLLREQEGFRPFFAALLPRRILTDGQALPPSLLKGHWRAVCWNCPSLRMAWTARNLAFPQSSPRRAGKNNLPPAAWARADRDPRAEKGVGEKKHFSLVPKAKDQYKPPNFGVQNVSYRGVYHKIEVGHRPTRYRRQRVCQWNMPARSSMAGGW